MNLKEFWKRNPKLERLRDNIHDGLYYEKENLLATIEEFSERFKVGIGIETKRIKKNKEYSYHLKRRREAERDGSMQKQQERIIKAYNNPPEGVVDKRLKRDLWDGSITVIYYKEDGSTEELFFEYAISTAAQV